MNTLSYEYKTKWWVGPAVILFFGSAAFFFMEKATHSYRGLVISRIIELSPRSAGYFYWLLFAFSMGLVVLGFLALAMSFRSARHVRLDEGMMIAPRNGLSNAEIAVPYKDITGLKIQEIQRQRFLHIEHRAGKLTLVQSQLPSRADFDEICSVLASRITAIQSAKHH
jgi:hypothetical protein